MCVLSDFCSESVSDSEIEVLKCNISKYLFKIDVVGEILLLITVFRLWYFLFYMFRVGYDLFLLQNFFGSVCDLFVLIFVIKKCVEVYRFIFRLTP